MSSEPEHIVDTVVLLYFLLVDQDALLRDLIGDPLAVPLSVYDPDERDLPEGALRHSDLLSEMRRSIRHYEAGSRTGESPDLLVARVQRVDWLFEHDHLSVIEMTLDERALAAHLESREGARENGLKAPLGSGEAACVAIAHRRGWTIATDDEAALVCLEQLHQDTNFGYERIRKLLIRAGDSGRISKLQANAIHSEMRELGFWDEGRPFP